ncbi:Hypothetical protein CM240_1026 [Clostridium bornimense]|uniref:PA14 domain-containing protein n=1 Tax=Clostridium bornimense TaxID=1216932 RepID=W6SES7_9CLOT|nr:fibro-slime domain-containing protein [Clostridium bornimense]CDM68190.1 Hypothetical protein CM240_1026 [Clostridium bornimense]
MKGIRRISKFLLIVICLSNMLFNVSEVKADNEDEKVVKRTLPITVRDFNSDWKMFSNGNDFTDDNNKQNVIKDMVEGIDPVSRKIIFSTEGYNYEVDRLIKKGKFKEGNRGTLDEAKKLYEQLQEGKDVKKKLLSTAYGYAYYYMNSYFQDVEGLNTIVDEKELPLYSRGGDAMGYDSSNEDEAYGKCGFFIADGKGFNEERAHQNCNGTHNYHFTLESHTEFTYKEGQWFEFAGDDDVWVFINGELIADIGGVHAKKSVKVELDKLQNLIPGETYSFDLFYMERGAGESNLTIETNMNFRNPNLNVEENAYTIDSNGEESPAISVYEGEKIYYTFTMTNTGDATLKNIEFDSELLGVKINTDGIFKNGVKKDSEVSFIKKDSKGNIKLKTNDFKEALGSLSIGETIEVRCNKELSYTATEEDANAKEPVIINEVVGTATYEENKLVDEAEVAVNVKKIGEYNATIRNNVNTIERDGEVIYDCSKDEVIPKVKKDDVVTFKFDVINKTVDKDGNPLPIDKLSISDAMTPADYNNDKWEFYSDDIKNFDSSNFNLGANEKIEVITNEYVVKEDCDNIILVNTVVLNRLESKLDQDSVSLDYEDEIIEDVKGVTDITNDDDDDKEKGNGILTKTGGLSVTIFAGIGIVLVAIGAFVWFKKR